jgi:hypothetical protein
MILSYHMILVLHQDNTDNYIKFTSWRKQQQEKNKNSAG